MKQGKQELYLFNDGGTQVPLLTQETSEKKYKKYKELNGYQFIISSNNTNLFEFPRSRKDKVKLLKLYIYKNMMDAWQKKPKNIATLEKEFVKEICTALET